ncbi:hypothetical protein N2152v2_010632 [Parachlorella kessleri]
MPELGHLPAGSSYEDFLQAEDLALEYQHRSTGLHPYPQEATEYDSEGSSTEAPSLSDMRNFIDSMQHKYQITPPKQPSAAQQKLAQLRREAAAARHSGKAHGRRGSRNSSDDEVSDDDDSEVEAFVAGAYQQQPAPGDTATWAGEREGDRTRVEADILRCGPQEAGQFVPPALAGAADITAVRERLAAAEARLESFESTQGELVQVKQQLEDLKEQHASLRSGANLQGEACTPHTRGSSNSSSSTAGGSTNSSSKPSSSSSTGQEGELSAAEVDRLREHVETSLGRVQPEDGALIIYTSGTTGNPKGALHTHRSVMAQVRTLCEAWQWQPSDRILHSLPLHHIHGVVNALYCALYAGATVEFLPKFSPEDTWQRLMRKNDPLSLFMGVPTMYAFLLNKFDKMSAEQQSLARQAAGALRLTVSGSSACPLPLMSRWEELSGQRLLERYGMSETGMILGNPYEGERRPGTVGLAFPGVDVKLVGKPGDRPGVGEVHIRSEQLFSHYWRKPEATKEAFDSEGYFITGDIAELSGSPPYYSLLGRSSVDIIKHGGFKLSALQIESVLLEHPSLQECAVVGVPDPTYGEAVCLLAVTKPGSPPLELDSLRTWAADKLSKAQTPSRLLLMDALPRNAMGKINKKELRKLVPEK